MHALKREGRDTLIPAKDPGGEERSRLLAVVLAGAWRTSPPPLTMSLAELGQVTPLLLSNGTGGLGWWRIRGSDLGDSESGKLLQQAYRLHTLVAAMREQQIVKAVTQIRAAGVEPILAKGWTVGRLYPERGLRPYGDIDLYVSPNDFGTAMAALKAPEGKALPVDLHRGCPDLGLRSLEPLLIRSQLVDLQGIAIRVLAPEDQLRLLCRHLLKHGARRALLLCDIAATLECQPEGFDWEYFDYASKRNRDRVWCVLGLAHQILEARLGDCPFLAKCEKRPRWLIPAVWSAWEAGILRVKGRIIDYLWRPWGLPEAIRSRWPNPIEGTYRSGGQFLNELPRFPFQLGGFLYRFMMFTSFFPSLMLRAVQSAFQNQRSNINPAPGIGPPADA